ncbi:MAG TPA: hypothetical protein VFS00_04950, partial [Polyangiaceae bacterium]|nr:hypothetical protein [Polyangiaceae bacterium]
MSTCPQCGANFPSQGRFCGTCGFAIPVPPPEPVIPKPAFGAKTMVMPAMRGLNAPPAGEAEAVPSSRAPAAMPSSSRAPVAVPSSPRAPAAEAPKGGASTVLGLQSPFAAPA